MSNNHKSRSNGNNRRGHRESKDFSQSKPVKVSDMALRLVPLGGLEEFGKNMWAIEQGDDIILADMGLQMPGADQPGVDFIVPNATYLREKASQIRGLFLTNGHYSSIGAVPYILHLFPGIDIFATEATFATLESRRSFYSQNMKYRKHIVDEGSSIRLGSIKVDVFKLNFNFAGNIGLCFYTLQGKVIYAPSFKFDYDQANEKMVDLGHIASLTEGGVFALLVGATGAEAEGYAPSEASVGRDIDKVGGDAKGRVFFSTYSSMLTRMQQIVDAVEKHDKKLYIEGKSILNTFNNITTYRCF
jgi:ribonuclease J